MTPRTFNRSNLRRGAAVLGAAVFLVGNPYGLTHSVSQGHVSGLSRRLKIGSKPLGGLIQVQVPLYPGDSGALLADTQGGWLGLVRSGLAVSNPKEKDDFGFAIPARDALWVARQLLEHQKVARAFLGIKLSPDSPGSGAEISSVIADSPAEKAKLQAGDRIIKIDDQEVATVEDLTDQLDRTRAGTEITLELLRGETRESVTVVTSTRPTQPPPVSTPAPAPPPKPEPTPAAQPQPGASAALPREVIERIERLEKQLDEYHRRERDSQRDSRSVP